MIGIFSKIYIKDPKILNIKNQTDKVVQNLNPIERQRQDNLCEFSAILVNKLSSARQGYIVKPPNLKTELWNWAESSQKKKYLYIGCEPSL